MKIFNVRSFASLSFIATIITSSIAPIGNNSILAAPINPQFLQSAAIVLSPRIILISFTDLEGDAIHHLREFTLATSEETVLGGKAAKLMGLV
jgi:hypothetical protein